MHIRQTHTPRENPQQNQKVELSGIGGSGNDGRLVMGARNGNTGFTKSSCGPRPGLKQILFFFWFLEPKNGPVFGPRKRLQKMARAISWCTNQSPFSGHEIGTAFSEPEREKKINYDGPGDRRLAVMESSRAEGSSGRAKGSPAEHERDKHQMCR